MRRALIIDIDGTLVDSNYQHVIAWQRAFDAHGYEAEAWKVHRYVGKGGDQMIASVVGPDAERGAGDEIRETEAEKFQQLIGEVKPFEGSAEFVDRAVDAGFEVVLASSAKSDEVDHYLELLGVSGRIAGHTTSADVESTKPEPDLVEAAIEKLSTREAIMIGDSIWDVEAAKRAGLESIAVLTGGFSMGELRAAGAREVQPALKDLSEHLGDELG